MLIETGRVFQNGRLAMKQDGCGMWAPRELHFETTDPATETTVKSRIVAIEAGHLAGYALDGACLLICDKDMDNGGYH